MILSVSIYLSADFQLLFIVQNKSIIFDQDQGALRAGRRPSIRNYHAILMVAVWFVLVPICIITVSVRYDSA